jgi:hypothetical protein
MSVLNLEFWVLGGFLPKPAPIKVRDPAFPDIPKKLDTSFSPHAQRGLQIGSSFLNPTTWHQNFLKRERGWEKKISGCRASK